MKEIEVLLHKINGAKKNSTTDLQKMRAFAKLRNGSYKFLCTIENITIDNLVIHKKGSNKFLDTNNVILSFSDKREITDRIAQIDKGEHVEIDVKVESLGFDEKGDFMILQIENIKRV